VSIAAVAARWINRQHLVEVDLGDGLQLLGWRGYFGFCQTPRVLTNLEAWIRRRLRAYLWRQWQNGRNRFKELRQRGLPKFHAAVAAGSPTGFWRMSGHPAVQQALRNPYFHGLGLPRLYELNPIEPPWYGPVCPVVWEWCGRGDAVRRPPIPIDRRIALTRRLNPYPMAENGSTR
jgi:RNA-directed DNA polymerase